MRITPDKLHRLIFWILAALGAGSIWLVPYPPMTDLPQNAAQITLLRDYLLGQSPWSDLIYPTYFTPYLLAHLLAAGITIILPVLLAMKLMLTAAFAAYLDAAIRLRRHYRADWRLDVLLIPVFFGHAWHWGFFSFLLAVPVGLWFVLLAARYAEIPNRQNSILLAATGALLFFSHGLIFGFCVTLGGLLLVCRQPAKLWVKLSWPWMVFAALTAAYFTCQFSSMSVETGNTAYGPFPVRLLQFGCFLFSGIGRPETFLLALALLAAPLLTGLKPDFKSALPAVFMAFCWFALPYRIADMAMMYQRFIIFAVPFYILLFPSKVQARQHGQIAILFVAAIGILFHLQYVWHFRGYERDFMTVMEAAQPRQRALMLSFDDGNDTPENYELHYHTALWYQAYKQGLVDFNFLSTTAMILHYKPDMTGVNQTWLSVEAAEFFDWDRYQVWRYRYIFVHQAPDFRTNWLKDPSCTTNVVTQKGEWSLYEVTNCR